MVIDQFDEMLEQSRTQPLVMGIALHAMIVGQPFRLRALRSASIAGSPPQARLPAPTPPNEACARADMIPRSCRRR